MLNFLKRHFSSNTNYLVLQKFPDEINSFFMKNLFNRTQFSHKKDIWGKVSEKIPLWGKELGWVPDHLPLMFLSETVELEIAEAISNKHGQLITSDKERDIARLLLDKLGIVALASRNPFFLSEGETKMVWLLSQWAKSPQYLIIGNLPASLSNNKIDIVIEFLLNSNKLAKEFEYTGPSIILGCYKKGNGWHNKVLKSSNWQFLNCWPKS